MGETLEFEALIDTLKTKLNNFGETEATLTVKITSTDPEEDFGSLTGMHGSKVMILISKGEKIRAVHGNSF